jgi:ribosomal protein S18 acetylase RimI-like enzyme
MAGMTRVRPATPADIGGLVGLVEAEGRDGAAMRERFETDLRDPERGLFLAMVGGGLAGYGRSSGFVPPEGAPPNVAPAGYYLGGLLVGSAWRRRGVGQALTQARMAWAFARAAEVWYFTNARNQASLALHAALGFVEVTRDFVYPGVSFEGGVGVLCHARRGPA